MLPQSHAVEAVGILQLWSLIWKRSHPLHCSSLHPRSSSSTPHYSCCCWLPLLRAAIRRVLKVSELARTVSQQSVARAASLKTELSAAQDHARRARRRAAAADKSCKELREENAALKQKLLLLERLHLELGDDCRTSACARAYLFPHSMSLY